MNRIIGVVALVGLMIPHPTTAAPPQAELILLGGKLWTVNPGQPEAQALAVWRGRILAVGSDAEIQTLAGPKTRILRLQGRRVLPGFYDSHVHLLGGGLGLSRVALKDARDEAEFGRRLQEFDKKIAPGRWLLGGDWDHDRAFGGQLPTAELVDKYVKDRPVFLRRYDGHMALVNTKVLELAGITAETKDPPGGTIVRKPGSMAPSGILRDNAMGLVRFVPDESDEELAAAIKAALDEARRFGVTSVQDMDGNGPETRRKLLRLYQGLARSGGLTLRIGFRCPIAEQKSLAALGIEQSFGGDWVKIGGLKGFIDGSLGSSTARMFQPFDHEPGNTGVYVTPPDRLLQLVREADRAGLNVAVHAIGDRANSDLLDLFAEVEKANGPRDRRFRVEHAQHLAPRDFARYAQGRVIASMQPYHIIDDGRWAEGRIGKARCASSYACRSFLDAGVKLAFGSDWPVAPLDPLAGIDAAVNRRTLDGKHPQGWFPEQKITVAEAIAAYTLGSAFAAHEDQDKGSLEPGKLADLVVLDRDILAAAARDRIAECKVVLTVVGGKVVHQRGDF